MKICVFNGSPKGEDGTTVQYARYIEKKISGDQYVYFNVASDIKKIEKDQDFFDSIMDALQSSDGVIWAFPLYVLMVHASLKRFVELIFERQKEEIFKGKYTALIAGSIHFFDNTAINYMHAICDDLEMRYAGCFSADMQDIMDEKKRAELLTFGRNFLYTIEEKLQLPKTFTALPKEKIEYMPVHPAAPLDTQGQKTLILTDSTDKNKNIGKMVERFRALTQADVVDISGIKMLASCQGCIQCGFDNECVFHGKDDVEKIYGMLENYHMIVYAGEMQDRYLSARWKMFMDRKFFKTHQPNYTNKQVGYLISGPFSQNQNLREIFEAMAQLSHSNLCGFLTDEYASSAEIDLGMDVLASRMINFSVQKYCPPKTFLGVGGIKIFRDDMWGRLRFPFRMDYKYYKTHGYFDFPQKNLRSRLENSFLLFLIRFPKIKDQIRAKMKYYMMEPYKKVMDSEEL